MKKEPLERGSYLKPLSETITIEDSQGLLETSFHNDGGHNDAGDDSQPMNSKQVWFWEKDSSRTEPSIVDSDNLWDD